jgi:hypothetical protein
MKPGLKQGLHLAQAFNLNVNLSNLAFRQRSPANRWWRCCRESRHESARFSNGEARAASKL